MEQKKTILTYAGLKKLEDELHDLKVNKRRELPVKSKKQESRETFLRMLSTMQQKMSREILRPELKKSKKF